MTTAQLLMMLIMPASALVLAGFAILLQKTSKPPRERGVQIEAAKTRLEVQDERAAKIEANLQGIRREIKEIRNDSVLLYAAKFNVKASPSRIAAIRAARRRSVRIAKEVEDVTKAVHHVYGTVPR